MAGERVVEVAALAAAPEAGQVDGDAAAERERGQPVERARRDAVQEDRRHRVVAGTAQEDRLVVELETVSVTVNTAPDDSLRAVRTLCFGDAIVDLICHRPVSSYDEADAFVPSPGGVISNVAVTAARRGRRGVVRRWRRRRPLGRWLHERLAAERVDLRWFDLAKGHSTAVAFTTVDEHGEPSWDLYGDGVAASLAALDGLLLGAVEETDALLFTSNMLADKDAARLTMAARERALELGRPVVFDPSVRLHRWRNSPSGAAGALQRLRAGRLSRQVQRRRGAIDDRRGRPRGGCGVAAGRRRAARDRHARLGRGDPAREGHEGRRPRGAPGARAEHDRRRRRLPRRADRRARPDGLLPVGPRGGAARRCRAGRARLRALGRAR